MSEFQFYLSLFFRRTPLLALIVIGCTAAGAFVALTAPPVYKAEATLVVESPQIPGELASTTVQASVVEILEVITQRLMTRGNLLDLSRQFGVHADQTTMSPDQIVEDMESRIEIELPADRRNRASFLSVSFAASTGELSALVTNELVTQILRENVAMRTGFTAQTLEFFVREVARLDSELAEQGAQILEFKEAHKEALPDSLDYQRSRQSSLQERILQLDRELSSLRDRRTRLQDIYQRTGRSDIAGNSLTPEQRRLRQLEDQRASALSIYSGEHPQIKYLDGQIAALKAANIELGLGTETSPSVTVYELQISDIDGQIEFIEEQRFNINNELEKLALTIDEIPINAIALGTLERDYESLRLQYAQANANLADARTGDQIEAQSRGQRMSVTSQAVTPEYPSEPNRKLIVAAGFAGGVGLAVGLFLLLEVLNNTIRRPVDLVNGLGVEAFGTVPYIQTSGEIVARRGLVTVGIMGPIIAAGIAIYLIHLNYMPIDLLLEKITNGLGVSRLFGGFGAS
ncbi:MAG: Wzz/FepE/Etk N-terminal domain-containing protein [Hyphomicrobiales bacterium]